MNEIFRQRLTIVERIVAMLCITLVILALISILGA